MDPTSSHSGVSRIKFQKRPDSLKLDLLTIPEDNSLPINQSSYDDEVHVGFRQITYTVREGIVRKRQRTLLHDINGDFSAGELSAIVGPSGSGKSTLMNILAGYTTKNVQGKLFENYEERDENIFRKQSCYIMQDDNLQPLLTVHEAMTVAASLKLDPKYTSKERQEVVKEILESVSLWEHKKVQTNCLSGGQRKRLSVALELLKNPEVMFFDEPTSGLDSSTSKQCVMLLKKLAFTGRTIICTIHQPSAMVFEMFDHLYALADGRCIYQGSIKGLIPYLEECNLQCPPYHNPADYLLEVATGEHGDHIDMLVQKCSNGLCSDWRKRQRNSLQLQSIEHIDKMMEMGRITPLGTPPVLFPKMKKNKGGKNKSKKINIEKVACKSRSYSTSIFTQVCVLLRRNFLILSRDRTLTYSRIATHFCIALFIGVLYNGIGKDASNMLNNFNYMFFSVMFLMFTAFNCITTTFPSELPIITREHFNRWYSLKSYYLAVTFADVPVQIIATLIYSLLTYFLTMQPLESYRVVLFIVMCILISLVSQSLGLLVGAVLDIKNGVIFGPFCLTPFVIFSGFFVQLSDVHPYVQWIFHISFLKYGLEGMMLSILGYKRDKLPCEADYCHFVYPDKFLNQMDMQYADYTLGVIFLLCLTISLRIAAYLALHIQIVRRR